MFLQQEDVVVKETKVLQEAQSEGHHENCSDYRTIVPTLLFLRECSAVSVHPRQKFQHLRFRTHDLQLLSIETFPYFAN